MSIYVDDFKMCGRKGTLLPMIAQLNKDLDLDPPTKLHDSVYLGVEQHDVPFPKEIAQLKCETYSDIMAFSSTHSQSNKEVNSTTNIKIGNSVVDDVPTDMANRLLKIQP